MHPVGLPDLHFPALRCFYAVARAGSMSAAVSVLRMRQPGISKMIQTLERQLGTALLERKARGVEVTAAGAAVLASCERIFAEVSAVQDLHRERAAPRGEIFVAASDHVASYLLPPVIEQLRKTAPELVVRILTGAAHLITPGIAEGRPELGLFFKVPPSTSLDRAILALAPCQVVVGKRFARNADTLVSFIGSREVDDPSNRAFPTLAMLRRQRPETSITVSSSGLEAHKTLVRRGVGISILPLFMVEAEIASKELTVLNPEYTYFAELEVVTRRGRRPSRNTSAFLAEVRRSLRAFGLFAPGRTAS